MTVIYPSQNYFEDENQNKPDLFDYDLGEEKKLIAEATKEIKKELLEKWKKRYANTPIFPDKLTRTNPELINFLLAFKNTLFYNDLAKKFSLAEEQRDIIPQVVWDACVNKNLDNFSISLQNKLNIDQQKTKEIVNLIEREILGQARVLAARPFTSRGAFAEKQEIKFLKLSFLPALQKYPKVGEQPVTASPIKLRGFPAPARPSIKNWITDYRENLGAGRHGVVERGNYLFHSENAKRLSSGERQKLAWILKSLEEDAPLEIDTSSEIIIFPPSPHSLPGQGEGTRSEGFKRTGGQPVKQTTNNRQQTTYNQQPTINNLQSATSSQSIVSPKKSFLQSIFSKKEKQDEIPIPKSTPQKIKKPAFPLAGAAKTEEKNKETSQPSPAPRKIYKDIKFSRPSFNEINPIGGFEDEFENNSRSGAKINGNKVDLRQ